LAYSQTGRRLKVRTPLGGDALLLNGFSGQEAISRPFSFQLQCVAENAIKVPFEALLGENINVEIALPGGAKRFINGCCLRVAQGARDTIFTRYLIDIVPKPFLLTRKTQSRIFQHVSIPDILKDVLKDFDVIYELKGTFQPRDYCVQYREPDWAFASRLMEEEGFYYFFKHGDGSHTMVVANSPERHPPLPVKSTLYFDVVSGGVRDEDRINTWEKAQELRSSKVTLWDHCFELPHKHLEAEYPIDVTVAAGKSSHKLKLKANPLLELYDYPGAYAQRFDGINKGGGEQPAEIQKIFQDNARTAEVRMQSEAAGSVLVHAASNCRQIVSGHEFTLERHFEGDGTWVVYQVEHVASEGADLRSGGGDFSYQNHFSCFPIALPFRPPRVTPIPVVRGTQTAVVVGPAGEEIFTDKYGRIKVQFHWDRQGKKDSDSSCWVRVATSWAGQRWGAIHIPRIGQEVVVDFLEGDMDQPIVIGSVYNAECMPPYDLPANKTQSGVKSRSTLNGGPPNFNEIRFEDKKGSEQVLVHAEKNQDIEVENDETHWVGHDRKKTIDHDETTHVKHDRTETVDNNETITVHANRTETVNKDESVTIYGNRTLSVNKDQSMSVEIGNQSTVIKIGNQSTEIKLGDQSTGIKMGNQSTKLDLGQSSTEAMQSIELKVGQSSVKIDQMGVTIKGMMIKIEGQIQTEVKGTMTQINGDALLQLKGGITMIG